MRRFTVALSPFGPRFLQLNHERLPGRLVAAHEPSRLTEAQQIFVRHFAKAGPQFV
jgi:hypothetical protein